MVPRTVQMAKEVQATLAFITDEIGNIVAPSYRGWTNNAAEYYTELVNSYGVQPGNPTGFNYNVHSFTGSHVMVTPTLQVYYPTWNSKWAQPPQRPVDGLSAPRPEGGINCSWIYPKTDNSVPPPIGVL